MYTILQHLKFFSGKDNPNHETVYNKLIQKQAMAYVDLIGHFCCSRYLYMNAKNRKVKDANILPMTQRPLQKVTYKMSKLAKDKKKKQSEQSTQYCKKTLSKSQQSSTVQIYDRLLLYRVEF